MTSTTRPRCTASASRTGHRNRRALTARAAGASTPRTCPGPAGGPLFWPTHPPLLTTRPAGASDNGRPARGRLRPSFPLKPPTPARRRSRPGARQRPSPVAMWPPHSPHSPRSTPSPTCTPRPTSLQRFVLTPTPTPTVHTPDHPRTDPRRLCRLERERTAMHELKLLGESLRIVANGALRTIEADTAAWSRRARDAASRVTPAADSRPEPLARHLPRELGGDGLLVDDHRATDQHPGGVERGHQGGPDDAAADRAERCGA